MPFASGSRSLRYAAPVPARPSSLAQALQQVGDRWTLLVVDALLGGPLRFGDLQEGVAGIAPNILAQRLRHLAREHLLVARPYSRRPPRMTYELTAAGRDLAGALMLLAQWGARQSGTTVEGPRHAACGTPVESRLYCPTCAGVVEADEGTEISFL